MFRLLDREHMLTHVEAGFDLWELERVWEMRNDILVRLRREGGGNMPGVAVGGPWPAEWIDLFERWMQNPNADDIGHHLVLAEPTARTGFSRRPTTGGGCPARSPRRAADAARGSPSTPSRAGGASTPSTSSRRCPRSRPVPPHSKRSRCSPRVTRRSS
jgi:hypothetical protein